MDVAQLLHNRPLMIGVAAAGGLGLIVLLRRRGGAGGTDPSSDTVSGNAGGGLPAFNSIGSDVAAQLGQADAATAARLQEFLASLRDELSGIIPAAPAPQPTTTPPVKKAVPASVPGKTPSKWVTVSHHYTSRNPSWDTYLSGIAGHEHTTVSALLKLNPNITNPDLIYYGQRIRVA
jgi:hypothetical protein